MKIDAIQIIEISGNQTNARFDQFFHECLENCQNERTDVTYLSKTAHKEVIKIGENLN